MLAKYGTLSLYNLAEDPGETQNLASQYPDRVAAMKRKLSDLLRGAVPTGAAAVSAEKDPTDQ